MPAIKATLSPAQPTKLETTVVLPISTHVPEVARVGQRGQEVKGSSGYLSVNSIREEAMPTEGQATL